MLRFSPLREKVKALPGFDRKTRKKERGMKRGMNLRRSGTQTDVRETRYLEWEDAKKQWQRNTMGGRVGRGGQASDEWDTEG